MNLLRIISLAVLLAYIVRILSYRVGWKRVVRSQNAPGDHGNPENRENRPPATLVVPLRNEERNIGPLLEDLEGQDYPAGLLEVILVDDHSEDATPEIAGSFCRARPGFRFLRLGPSETGKQAALEKGVRAAQSRIILNTDGDCRVPGDWTMNMVSGLGGPGIRMVAGTVNLAPDRGIFKAAQSLESFSLTAVSAGSAGLRRPVLCSGASLACYREDYLEFLAEHEKVSESGDDVFLMLWLKKKYPGPVGFAAEPGSAVRTLPEDDLLSFFRQRMRWVSKFAHFRDPETLVTAILVMALNLLLLVLLLAFLIFRIQGTAWLPLHEHGLAGDPAELFGILFLGKSLADLLLLVPVLRHFGKTRLLLYFLPLQMVYFMYVSMAGVLGQFASLSWKGRKVRTAEGNKNIEREFQP